MNRISIFLLAIVFVSCNNNSTNPSAAVVDTAGKLPVAEKPSGPPLRIAGTFTGNLPCIDCRETETILTLKEDTYNVTKLNKGIKDKTKMLETKAGYCVFENGIVKLLEEKIVTQQFRIISEDSIRLLTEKGEPVKGKGNAGFFLIRKAKK